MRRLGFALFCSLLLASVESLAAPATRHMPAPLTATITIVRSQDRLFDATPAVIHLNGNYVTTLTRGQAYTEMVPIGSMVLTVSAPSIPGQSSLRFDTKPGDFFQFMVLPRTQNAELKIDTKIAEQLREGHGPFIIVPVDVN